MAIRVLVVLVTATLIALPSRANAQVLGCGRYETQSDCTARIQLEQQVMAEQARRNAENRANAINSITEARQRFWATYPAKPGAEKAKKDFAYWLWIKDLYYLKENLKAPVTRDPRTGRRTSTDAANVLDTTFGLDAPIDDGIRKVAVTEFEDWVNAVRDKLFEGHTSNSTDDAFMQGLLATWMGQKFVDAVQAASKQYEVYVTARDWWEFDHVNRVPAGFDTPESYGIYLYSRFHHQTVPIAAANYKKMTDLLGAQRVQAAAKRVMDAPKRDDGGLIVTVEATKKGPGGDEIIDYDKPVPADIMGAFADPVRVMEMLSTQDDDRRYLLDLLHRHAPDLRKLDPATTWTWAETAYKRLVLAFGEQELLAASHAVRVAPKRLYSGGVITVNELGVKRTEPIETVEDLLVMKDPRGYVRAALIFSKDLDTAAAVDAAYKTYVSAKGEQAVLDAARRRAVNKPQLTYKPEIEFIDAEMKTPTVAPTQGPQMDFPKYLGWKGFAPGASASYINRNLGQTSLKRDLEGGGQVGIRTRYLLRSITPERADLFLTEIAYDPPPASTAHPPRDTEMAYPARIDATPSARTAATANTPLQSGDETLVVGGKKLATHWQAEQMPGAEQQAKAGCSPTIVTTWRSDEVPGGLVRETSDQICRDNRYPGTDAVIRKVRETLLESFDTSGPTTGVRPIQPAALNTSILPLPVPAVLPGQQAAASTPQQAAAAGGAGASRTGAAAATPAPAAAGRGFDPNMRASAPATAPSSAAAPAASASSATTGRNVPAGTAIAVMTSGLINATTNKAGDGFRGTIMQPIVVNGATVIAPNTTVSLQVVGAGDSMTVQLAGITMNGGTIAAGSSQVALDPQTAALNATYERSMAAVAGNPRGAATQQALAARIAVVSGARMNLPSGTRLTFTLASPIAIDGPAAAAPGRPTGVSK
jgi:hypothetical protein